MKKSNFAGTVSGFFKFLPAVLLCIAMSVGCTDTGLDEEGTPDEPDTEKPGSEDKPSTSGRTVGYLVYSGFEHSFFNELLAVFDEFKAAGITDLILDLRDNPGGNVLTSRGLTSIVAGPDCAGKVFSYERYNNDRMKSYGCDPEDYTTYESSLFFEDLAKRYGFNFQNVYVIISDNTASASELLINSLRGIDRKVTLVGETASNGKDVGMEVPYEQKYGSKWYQPVVISFQSYNAKGESDYNDGFKPDLVPANEYKYRAIGNWGLPLQWGAGYDHYKNTSTSQLRYDYLIDALVAVNGRDFVFKDVEVVASSSSSRSATRSSERRIAEPGNMDVPVLKADLRAKNPLKNNMYIRRDMPLPVTRVSLPGGGDTKANKEFIGPWMEEYYLWNDAYRQTEKDYSLSCDEFLEDVLTQILETGANTQDGFMYDNKWHFYSYVDWWSAEGTRAETRLQDNWEAEEEKESYHGFGLSLYPAYMRSGGDEVGLVVKWVYPGSPADKAGIVRSDAITKINGVQITESNYYDYYVELFYDEYSSPVTRKFTLGDVSSSNEIVYLDELTVSTADYYRNPIIFTSIYRFKK